MAYNVVKFLELEITTFERVKHTCMAVCCPGETEDGVDVSGYAEHNLLLVSMVLKPGTSPEGQKYPDGSNRWYFD